MLRGVGGLSVGVRLSPAHLAVHLARVVIPVRRLSLGEVPQRGGLDVPRADRGTEVDPCIL